MADRERCRNTYGVFDAMFTFFTTRALLRLERTMNLLEGGKGGEGKEGGWGREGGEGTWGRAGGWGREGGEGGRRREGSGGEGERREGGMTVTHILIGMFNSNPMIPQYLNNNLT